jgi:hypothetical protein
VGLPFQPRHVKRKGIVMNNQELLKRRHGEQIEDARQLLQLLTARLDEEAAMTDYDWCHVGDSRRWSTIYANWARIG